MTGIKLSDTIIEQMISDFCKGKGHEYRAVSEHNIPLAFVYMTEAKSFYGSNVSRMIAEFINKSSKNFSAISFKNSSRYYIKRKGLSIRIKVFLFWPYHTKK